MSTTQLTGVELKRNSGSSAGRLVRKFWWIPAVIVVAVVAVMAAMTATSTAKQTASTATPLYTVESGPLTISVVASGTISSSQAIIIKSEVEGRTTVLSLIEEGKQVKAGELLIELDSAALADRKIDQEISVQNAEAAFIQAREALEVAKQQAQADVEAAQVDYDLAKLDLDKYMQGEYKNEINQAESDIKLRESELEQAQSNLTWSEKLHAEGFITESDLKKDQLALQKAQIAVTTAANAKRLLEEFTFKRRSEELKSAVTQKEFLLTKAKHKGASSIVEAEASLLAKETQLKREQEKLTKINDQLTKCKIYAPVDGMVVYATSSGSSSSRYRSDSQPLGEGVEIQERQELIRLPTSKGMKAEIKIHESVLEKVREGLPVVIKAEALPGKQLYGRVSRIALLPDAQSSWLNPDLKVYNTEIELTGDQSDLRPGMSCSAEIIVDHFDDTLYVPMQAVLRVQGKPTVYVPGPTGPEARPIEVGLDNNRMIQVKGGLKAGDKVLLAPPLPQASMRDGPRPSARPDIPAEGEPQPGLPGAGGSQRGGPGGGGPGGPEAGGERGPRGGGEGGPGAGGAGGERRKGGGNFGKKRPEGAPGGGERPAGGERSGGPGGSAGAQSGNQGSNGGNP